MYASIYIKFTNNIIMDSLVVYDTWTGNTRDIAESIAKGLGTTAVSLKSNPAKAQGLLVVGTPTHFIHISQAMKNYIKQSRPESMAVFTTYGAPGRFGEWTSDMTLKRLYEPGSRLVGSFKSRGFHPVLRTARGHPSADDHARALAFGRGLVGSESYDSGMNMWANQNLPFFCGLAQGFTNGMIPEHYHDDPNNYCSSKQWYGRGYDVGSAVKRSWIISFVMALLVFLKQ